MASATKLPQTPTTIANNKSLSTALMILVVTVKLFGFLRAITRYVERLISHKATFTMLRDIRVQFFGKLKH
jgi:ABC-type transport system involved in cytochrome bd biosynthesis fused ATPase/permease subunit